LRYDGSRFERDPHMESEMSKKITRSRPWTKEELRMLKTLTREKTRIVIGRKLKRSVDAMYGMAKKLGVMKPQPNLRKEGRGGDTPEQNDFAEI
jgi:hypothetical protein